MVNSELKGNIIRRLKRIEGQVKGIERMLDTEGCCCMDVLVQVSAVRAATSKVGEMILANYAQACLAEALADDRSDREKKLEDLLLLINNFIK